MKRKLQLIFKRLDSAFGDQHWWPGETPFEVIVGAILTQNTSWSNVEKAILKLKTKKLLGAGKLYRLPTRQLASLIKSTGYYNLKAKRLKNFLKFFFKRYQGKIKRMGSWPAEVLREQLLAVGGVGPETADSILLYALNKPVFVVDAYTQRILLRHRLIKPDDGYAQIQGLFMRQLKKDARLFNQYHALLVKLGKDYCRKHDPKCEICPLWSIKNA